MQALQRKSPAGAAGPGQTHYHATSDVILPHVEQLLSRLSHVRRTRNGWTARCPAHRDRSPSLSVSVTDTGKVLLHCFAGCPPEAVLAAIGLTWRDLARPATTEERLESELRRRLDDACFEAAAKLAEWARVFDGRTYGERFALARYLHLVPYLDWLSQELFADDVETRLQALKEAEPWL